MKRGFMTVEILVAVSIIAVTILSAMAVAQKSIALSRQAVHNTQASFLLSEGAEVIRIFRDNAWNNISILTVNQNYYPVFSGDEWGLSEDPNAIGIFTRTINMANVNRDNTTNDISDTGTDDAGTKLVTVTVSWPEGAVIVTKSLSFYIFNIFSE